MKCASSAGVSGDPPFGGVSRFAEGSTLRKPSESAVLRLLRVKRVNVDPLGSARPLGEKVSRGGRAEELLPVSWLRRAGDARVCTRGFSRENLRVRAAWAKVR